MNILGIGGPELILVLLIMLVVAGPKRMILWSRTLGFYLGKLRVMWSEVADLIQKEFDEAGVEVKVPKEMPTRQNINKMVADAAKPVSEPLAEVSRDINANLNQVSTVTRKPDTTETEQSKEEPVPESADSRGAKAQGSLMNGTSLGTWSNIDQE